MSKKYDLVVFIGRVQPVHIGHVDVINTALKLGDWVVALIGSARQPRTSKNPWTYEERKDMFVDAIDNSRFNVRPLSDAPYNDQQWAQGVQAQVEAELNRIKAPRGAKVALIGHTKDESSYYLKLFPQWDLIEHELNEVVNATDIRQLMFENVSDKFITGVVPPCVLMMIRNFKFMPAYAVLQEEYEMIKKYHKSWAAAPYAPTFVTVDAIVVQSGHVLIVERGAAPGRGLVAIPGGFLDQNERIIDGMIRELREETKLKVPGPVLKGSITKREVFDDPNRSLRGRTITHAFLIELPPGPLPVVKGSDDAVKAFWLPISELDESKFFEDHHAIIRTMLGL